MENSQERIFSRFAIILILAQIFAIQRECHFFALPLRQRSANIVVKCFACVDGNNRDWLHKQEKFPSSNKHDEAYFIFGFSLLKNTFPLHTHDERRNENCNSGFLFTSLRCCCSVHTLRIFFYSNDDASFISVEVWCLSWRVDKFSPSTSEIFVH